MATTTTATPTNTPSPLLQVKRTCNQVVNGDGNSTATRHVTIDDEKIVEILDQFINTKYIEWDENDWHYAVDAQSQGPVTCQYIFVLDCLNFCFWPNPAVEYDVIATRLKAVLLNDIQAFDANRLSTITASEVAAWFPGFDIPLLDERVNRLRELGYGLLNEEFKGLAANLVKKANHSCVKLVELILQYFPGFRDTVVYKGQLIHFYKRAQIVVGDLWAAYGRPLSPDHPYYFHDLDALTMFADYRVPQILRHVGVLKYSSALTQTIDSHQEIHFGSDEETQIRACTVMAVDRIQQLLETKGKKLFSIEIDWLLWQIGEKTKDSIPPHHRTLTIYY